MPKAAKLKKTPNNSTLSSEILCNIAPLGQKHIGLLTKIFGINMFSGQVGQRLANLPCHQQTNPVQIHGYSQQYSVKRQFQLIFHFQSYFM